MTGKIFACVTAVTGAAILTLAAMIALVQGTVLAVSIGNLPLRILAVCADMVVGIFLLLGCIYLATRLAVRILGVGNVEFPPLPDLSVSGNAERTGPFPGDSQPGDLQRADSPKI